MKRQKCSFHIRQNVKETENYIGKIITHGEDNYTHGR